MRHTKLLITLAFLLGGAPMAQAEDESYKEFKSWQTFCGQTRACTMRQFLSDSALSSVELRRSGKPEAPVSIMFSSSDSSLTESDGAAEVSITVDGGEAFRFGGEDVAVDTVAGSLAVSGDLAGSGLIEALKNGSTAVIRLSRGEKRVEGEVPLAGAAASLLFIDEYQDRIGHTDALVSIGDKAPNAPLPVNDITTIEELPAGIRSQFAEGGACAGTEPSMLEGNALSHKIDDNTTVYITPCGSSGAYNMPFAAYVDAYEMITPLAFPGMVEGAPSASIQAFNLGYDWKERTFSSFFKGRGVGDCGTYSEWKLVEGAMGAQLALVEETFRDCPSEFSEDQQIDPSEWPKTWPLK
ncbi:DUF1176 domain-containing protein [Rhizobium sp. AQ_MP]|uniref:DUF1176 domain-containing protein n=1 Tax=Rhizobium sp. AQ_MP TaxID=2761536 RepID=UPI00163A5EA4|nr:DUF1176 domain-containing protein [Rhizobium sp. AQ_MP]MBC2771568.1 DUF1176 domain-containing protein [Rhizobium sp. AQ_MP]